MTPTYSAKPGDPCWADISTSDVERTIDSYGELFGWEAVRGGPELGGYVTFRKDGRAVAGAMAKDADHAEIPDSWTIYFATPDIHATAAASTAAGGQSFLAPMQISDLGSMAVLSDNGGAAFGLWQPGTHPGFEAVGHVADSQWTDHVGMPSWFELHTRDYAPAVEFYRTAIGMTDLWTFSDAPEFRYTALHSTSPMLGGIMDATQWLPDGVPNFWRMYIGVDDVDATVDKLVTLGGAVVAPAENTPYGRLAAVTDPTGAHLSVGGNPQ